jgi:U3 small nucleolar RNA-associated protein 14
MLPSVPHGFDNREQYERTISNPLGKEWNSLQSHNSITAPKIRTKLGTPILPLKYVSLNNKKKQPKASL